MQPLPRFRIYSRPREYAQLARDVVSRRWNVGESCRELEEAIARRVDVGHAVCASKARVGIFLAIRALIQPGRAVILSPYTITDVINMVICAGGVPVFADLEPDTCNVDAAEVEKLIDAETGAVMVTHLHGLACDVERIADVCRQRGVPLVEDAAQAFGARRAGRHVGTFGDAGIYSFGMYKNMNAFFGGMVVTPHEDLGERLRAEIEGFPPQELGYYLSKVATGVATDVATWPPLFRSLVYRVFRFGFLHDVGLLNNQVTVDQNPEMKRSLPESYLRRLTPTQARLVLPQLDRVESDILARIAFAELYHQGLRDVPEIDLPPLYTDFTHTYTYFPIQVDDRPALLRRLMQERCDVAAQHLRNCADLDCFSEFYRDCPRARRTARSVVLLPTYPRYSLVDAHRNVRVIREYFGRA
ncbi:MAG: aminotransferase class V-fold PLP-dependent enzyme [Acidobacteria bacterium]|nr:aminotransferase class V-fold PLP-dependent enzyme [Acidobacteriota bacterium]